MLSAQASVAQRKLRTGSLTDDERKRSEEAADALSKSKFYINDTKDITTSEMEAKLRRLRNIDLVIIDYLQLISAPLHKYATRQQETSSILLNFKTMAKSLRIHVLVLSQLPHSIEKRTDRRPRLSDLQKIGVFEQDADVVLFLHRDYYYNSYSEKSNENDAKLSLLKTGAERSEEPI